MQTFVQSLHRTKLGYRSVTDGVKDDKTVWPGFTQKEHRMLVVSSQPAKVSQEHRGIAGPTMKMSMEKPLLPPNSFVRNIRPILPIDEAMLASQDVSRAQGKGCCR